MLSRKEGWDSSLRRGPDFILIACEKTPCTWLSTSQLLTGHFPSHSDSFFYCSFTNLWQWRLHYSRMVCNPAHSMAVRPLYHLDGLVNSRLVDSKGFLSHQQTKLEIKEDRDTVFCWGGDYSVQTVWGEDVFTSINIIHHLLAFFRLCCTARVLALCSCCIQSLNSSFRIFLYHHPVIQVRQAQIKASYYWQPQVPLDWSIRF